MHTGGYKIPLERSSSGTGNDGPPQNISMPTINSACHKVEIDIIPSLDDKNLDYKFFIVIFSAGGFLIFR